MEEIGILVEDVALAPAVSGTAIAVGISLTVLGVLCCAAVAYFLGRSRRKTPSPMADPRRQLQAVRNVEFVVKPLLPQSTARVLPLVEAALAEYAPEHRVMAQVALQEAIQPVASTSTSDLLRADLSIKSKRLDIAVVDDMGQLVAAMGCAGSHCSPMRDSIRREALQSAGVPYLDLNEVKDEIAICTFIAQNVAAQNVVAAGHGLSTAA